MDKYVAVGGIVLGVGILSYFLFEKPNAQSIITQPSTTTQPNTYQIGNSVTQTQLNNGLVYTDLNGNTTNLNSTNSSINSNGTIGGVSISTNPSVALQQDNTSSNSLINSNNNTIKNINTIIPTDTQPSTYQPSYLLIQDKKDIQNRINSLSSQITAMQNANSQNYQQGLVIQISNTQSELNTLNAFMNTANSVSNSTQDLAFTQSYNNWLKSNGYG